jgi:hypothetical protein
MRDRHILLFCLPLNPLILIIDRIKNHPIVQIKHRHLTAQRLQINHITPTILRQHPLPHLIPTTTASDKDIAYPELTRELTS